MTPRNIFFVLAVLLAGIAVGHFALPPHQAARLNSQHSAGGDYAPGEWTALSLPEIASAIAQKQVTAEQVVNSYLDRIARIDRTGPKLRSIITLNPEALSQARRLDALLAEGTLAGPLHGVPILLKDNIESADPMPTTAGALALAENITGRDSPLVAGLRASGAIILGKTNLSQWANFRSNDSMSGWSAMGGQVKNPHVLDRNPCGSSSGSGAAAAASLAAGAVGTETNGSIICPSNANGVVGFKPTVGLVSQQHIVPISASQDTAGPMTKTVRGAAMMLTAMASGDGAMDFAAGLDAGALNGKRVGVLDFARGGNSDINQHFDAALDQLEALGAELVIINASPLTTAESWTVDGETVPANQFWTMTRRVLDYEFKAGINAYLADTPDSVVPRTLAQLIAFNASNADIELALFDQSIFDSTVTLDGLDSPEYRQARAVVRHATGKAGIDKLLADHDVSVLVAPSGPVVPRIDPANGDVWPPFPGAGALAAIAGYPHATVPMGDVHGLPVGLSFIGTGGNDAAVLAAAYAYEQASLKRKDPRFLPSVDLRPEIAPALDGVVGRER